MVIRIFAGLLGLVILGSCNIVNRTVDVNKNQNINTPTVKSVVNLNVSQPLKTDTGKITLIDKILVGNVVNKDGSVVVEKNEFAPDTEAISVSAHIYNIKSGLKVMAKLYYLPTKETVGPAINVIEISGDAVSNFKFTKPLSGWPPGEYKVSVYLENGQSQTVSFNIIQ